MAVSRRHRSAVVLAAVLMLGACAGDSDDEAAAGADPPPERYRYPAAPDAPNASEPAVEDVDAAIDQLLAGFSAGAFDAAALQRISSDGDARHGWFLSDLLRFFGGEDGAAVLAAFEASTGASLAGDPDLAISPWLSTTNHMIAWDLPAYPGYADDKAAVLLQVEPRWEPLFADEEAEIDWRYLNWGGVLIDDRPLGDPQPCERGCIPSLDDPDVTDAAGGDWYPDDAIVFGVLADGDALAIPKNIAEVHEMFNLTLGGERLGIPYCTLCGSAQAFRTEAAAGRAIVLRTSGLLSRSNKVMYDLETSSVFDTFTGEAVSGPLREDRVVLEEITVVRSTWGAWKAEHPETSIISEDGGVGREYPEDPLRGRDDAGPIFPVGVVDDRLPAQELVVGVTLPAGGAVAFSSDAATSVLAAGVTPSMAGVELLADGDGLRAVDAATGDELAAHEAFWFAWSQFHSDTGLWVG